MRRRLRKRWRKRWSRRRKRIWRKKRWRRRMWRRRCTRMRLRNRWRKMLRSKRGRRKKRMIYQQIKDYQRRTTDIRVRTSAALSSSKVLDSAGNVLKLCWANCSAWSQRSRATFM